VCVYIYIYIERERERERKGYNVGGQTQAIDQNFKFLLNFMFFYKVNIQKKKKLLPPSPLKLIFSFKNFFFFFY
jgi:hypothetical protein